MVLATRKDPKNFRGRVAAVHARDGLLAASQQSTRSATAAMCQAPTNHLELEVAVEPPFPVRACAILILVNLAEPIVMGVLFPMAPFMVAEWVPADQVGTWAGMLTSAYNLASVPAGIFWGRLSDRVGRRKCMAWNLFGASLSIICFGLSRSLTLALLARLLGGCFGGLSGLVIAGIRDQCTKKQQAKAVPYISWAYGAGFAIGPVLGGTLSKPADHLMPALKGTLFETFPYLLPCLCTASMIIAAALGLIFLPQPKAATTPKKAAEAGAQPATSSTVDAPPADEPPAAAEGDGKRLFSGARSDAAPSAASATKTRCGAIRWACGTPIVALLWAYLFLNLGAIGSMELMPLFLARNDTSTGLALDPEEAGYAMLPQAATVLFMPFVYPQLKKRFGDKGVFVVGISSLFVVCIVLPMIRWLEPRSTEQWGLLATVSALRGTVGPLIFPAIIIIINRVITERFGFWNGLSSSVASLARAVAPTVFGALFAVGTAHGHLPFPLDVNLPFLLAMAVLLTSAILVVRTPTGGSEASFKRPKRLWSLKRARTAVVGT